MTNFEEARRWLKDAEAHFKRAKRLFSDEDFQGTVEDSQISLELSTKAIIAYFEEPIWRHDPGGQLLEIVVRKESELREKFGEKMIELLKEIAKDVDEAAPWHGWSTYGRKEPEGWVSGVDLCNEKIAKELLEKAEKALQVAQKFLK